MSQNAVADLAEPRKVNEQPLLEKGWQWIVQIGKTGKSPEVVGDLRTFGSQPKEIRENSKSTFDFSFQCRFLLEVQKESKTRPRLLVRHRVLTLSYHAKKAVPGGCWSGCRTLPQGAKFCPGGSASLTPESGSRQTCRVESILISDSENRFPCTTSKRRSPRLVPPY
jgi:hypothetical protein